MANLRGSRTVSTAFLTDLGIFEDILTEERRVPVTLDLIILVYSLFKNKFHMKQLSFLPAERLILSS